MIVVLSHELATSDIPFGANINQFRVKGNGTRRRTEETMKKTAKRLNDPPTAMKLISVLNRLMGLRPFNDRNGQPRIFLSLPYLVVLWCFMGGALTCIDKFEITGHKVDEYINYLYFYPYVFNGVWSTFLGYYHVKTFLVYKKKMSEVNESLHRLGVTPEYRGSFDNEMILIIAWFLQMTILFGISMQNIIEEVGVPIGCYICCFVTYALNLSAVIILDFIICVRSVELRYEKINDLLEVFATDGFQTQEKEKPSRALPPVIPLRSNNWTRSRTNVTTLEHLSRPEQQWEYIGGKNWRFRMIKLVHLELCHASKLLFKTFGSQVALQIRIGVLFTTLTLYYVAVCVILPQENELPPMIQAELLIGCITHFVKLLLLSRACDHAYREASKALTIVHACYPLAMDTETKDEIRLFALQLCHCQRGCTKRYFSQLNYSLISRCVSTITTYLFITLQVGESLN